MTPLETAPREQTNRRKAKYAFRQAASRKVSALVPHLDYADLCRDSEHAPFRQ